MPNHVTNRVSIAGPAEKIAAFHAAFASNESALDFERIKPMPEILSRLTTGATKINGETVRVWIEEKDADGNRVTRAPTAEEQAEIDATGATDWYEWACEHWGTKWNSYSSDWSHEPGADEAELKFDTAWSPPEPIFHLLALRPECEGLTIEIAGFDEGWGFAYLGKISDGTCLIHFTDATDDMHERVYGYRPERDEEDEDAA